MKIERIAIRNTIGLRHMDVALPSQLTLFAGPNGAGKTSIGQAIRLAMTAEPSRVSLKKDFDKLITEGSDSAGVQVEADGIAYCVGISVGKVTDNQPGRETPAAMPFVLDMHRLCSLSADERRAFLFTLTGIAITGDAVMTRLKERGCDMAMAEEVKPILRSGFPAAAEYAKKKATEGKGAWKATTGGETWGKPSGAVSAAAGHDNGRWNVADPRVTLPAADEKLTARIIAEDGTWHRPFTTLELAALQSLFDPDDALELDGQSDSAWRERIGNAVPSAAAQAIAGVMGHTLLLAWSGETFALGSTPIWVRPMVIALSTYQPTNLRRNHEVLGT